MPGKLWTKEEEDILRKLYGKVPIEEIMKVLKDRTYHAIMKKASYLGLKFHFKSNIDYEYLNKLMKLIEE